MAIGWEPDENLVFAMEKRTNVFPLYPKEPCSPKTIQTLLSGLLPDNRLVSSPSPILADIYMSAGWGWDLDYRNRHSDESLKGVNWFTSRVTFTGYISELIKKSRVYAKYTMPIAMASGYKIRLNTVSKTFAQFLMSEVWQVRLTYSWLRVSQTPSQLYISLFPRVWHVLPLLVLTCHTCNAISLSSKHPAVCRLFPTGPDDWRASTISYIILF